MPNETKSEREGIKTTQFQFPLQCSPIDLFDQMFNKKVIIIISKNSFM